MLNLSSTFSLSVLQLVCINKAVARHASGVLVWSFEKPYANTISFGTCTVYLYERLKEVYCMCIAGIILFEKEALKNTSVPVYDTYMILNDHRG